MDYWNSIDDFINGCVDRHIEKLNPPDVDKYLAKRKETTIDPYVDFLARNIHHIHSNISSLLTHISAMIASLGIILIVFEDSKITQIFIFIEIIIYTILALFCVYNLRYRRTNPIRDPFKKEDYIKLHYRNYLNRRYVYTICSNGVLINTIFFLITICAHVVALIGGG